MGRPKKEYPPLFGLGFHPRTIAEVRAICVDAFPKSKSRAGIMDGLEQVIGILQSEGIQGELWLDGSFTTEKKDPKDVDLVLYYEGEWLNAASMPQQNRVRWLALTDLKPAYKCDSYCTAHFPAGHPAHMVSDWWRGYWLAKFGFSRAEQPKGLIVITL